MVRRGARDGGDALYGADDTRGWSRGDGNFEKADGDLMLRSGDAVTF
jgi:hypothetical protein